jgi:hypothetical protein
MSGLGLFKRNDKIPIIFNITPDPTGTPQFRILNADFSEVVTWADLDPGVVTGSWKKENVTVGAAAIAGTYIVEYKAVVDGDTAYWTETYSVTLNSLDDLAADIASLGSGAGAQDVYVRIQDAALNNQVGAIVHIYDATNTTALFSATTDSAGKARFNIDLNLYYVRVSHGGFSFTPQTINVTGDLTFTLFGTVNTYTPPVDSAICRLHIVPKHIDGSEPLASEITITAHSPRGFAKTAGGHVISNKELTWTFDASTDPDNWYIDLIRNVSVRVDCKELAIAKTITVPDSDSADFLTVAGL